MKRIDQEYEEQICELHELLQMAVARNKELQRYVEEES